MVSRLIYNNHSSTLKARMFLQEVARLLEAPAQQRRRVVRQLPK
jgi:hypothetical protein